MGHRYPSPTRFKVNRTYTVPEVAATGAVCENTVHNWRKVGLQVIDHQRPLLFTGSEMRRFLTAKRQARKTPCSIDELYCLGCRAPRRPAGGVADFMVTGTTGRLTGLCPVCAAIMHRRVALNNLPSFAARLEIKDLAPLPTATLPAAHKDVP